MTRFISSHSLEIHPFRVQGVGMQTAEGEMTMGQLLEQFPWARRALFQKFHIGGCASCGFSESESLSEVCERTGGVAPSEVLAAVRESHAEDEATMVSPVEAKRRIEQESCPALDIRTMEEFEAVHIPGSRHFDQEMMAEIMASWPKDRAFLIVDHTGDRSLDAASYFAGHGFSEVRCVRGGIDAFSAEADSSLPRYTLE